MARRKVEQESINHERWLISYADFITLLFAFFVVMYSISQVNEGKYKVLSETLSESFSQIDGNPERTINPFQVGEVAKSNPLNVIELEDSSITQTEGNGEDDREGEALEQGGFSEPLNRISNQIESGFGKLVEDNLITVRGNEEWLEVELKSSLLFASGDAQLSNSALELLSGIADILRAEDNPVRVEGFTDNIPINTAQFPSNWDLSTARASAVVQLFVEEELNPARFAAIGYGEYQPIADNTTEEGRSSNRRVVLMISKTGELRPALRQPTLVEELSERVSGENAGAGSATSFDIIIPGVNDEPLAATQGDAAATDSDGQQGEGEQGGGLSGVKTIQLEDGGILFTSEEEPVPEL